MKSSNFDESEIPWPMPRPRTMAERAKLMRMDFDQRYMGVEFSNVSFSVAYAKGEVSRHAGLPKTACPVRLEWDGSEGVLRMAWELGWEMADEEIFIGSL